MSLSKEEVERIRAGHAAIEKAGGVLLPRSEAEKRGKEFEDARNKQRAGLLRRALAAANTDADRIKASLLAGEKPWWKELAPLTTQERMLLLAKLRRQALGAKADEE